jgi:hypothetical protein
LALERNSRDPLDVFERARFERALALVEGPRFESALEEGTEADLDELVEEVLSKRA